MLIRRGFATNARIHTMSTTLVALFSERAQAEQAQRRLQAAGIGPQAMQLNNGVAESAPAGESGALRRFFSQLFGNPTNADTLQGANAALTVAVADDRQAGEVREVLQECGALGIDTPAPAEHAEARHLSEGDGLIHGAPSPVRYSGPERRIQTDLRYLGAERRGAA
jgi:hypothetical protein